MGVLPNEHNPNPNPPASPGIIFGIFRSVFVVSLNPPERDFRHEFQITGFAAKRAFHVPLVGMLIFPTVNVGADSIVSDDEKEGLA